MYRHIPFVKFCSKLTSYQELCAHLIPSLKFKCPLNFTIYD